MSGFNHPVDPHAIVDEDAHPLLMEGELIARQLARSLSSGTGDAWTSAEQDEDLAHLERPPLLNGLVYHHSVVRERDGLPIKVLVQLGRPRAQLAMQLEGEDYDDTWENTWHVRPKAHSPIDIALDPAQFAGSAPNVAMTRFLVSVEGVWSRVLVRRLLRGE